MLEQTGETQPVDTGAGTTADATTNEPVSTGAEGAGAAPDKAGTIAGSDVEDKPVAAPADWPEDWREKLANGDDKMLARLKRFQSPANVLKSWRELETKVTSGEYKKQPGKDASPEQIAEWRKENGLPTEAEGYKFDLGGIIPPEQDKPILDGFKAIALENNLSPEAANKMVSWYYQQQENLAAEQAKADAEFRMENTVLLRGEWGAEFKPNLNAMNTFLDATMPDGLKDRVFGARLADGTLFGDDPNVLRWLVDLARDHMPGADLVPAGTPNVGKGIEQEIATIEAMQANDDPAYYSGGFDKRLLALYDARAKRQSRAA